MKFGILYNKSNMNIGDDIQAYATERFLPQIDYYIDRENIDSFTSENNEPVAVIMNAWYMWRKWNWPPSKCIYPLMVGFHYADHQLANQWYGSPLKYQFLGGLGGEYLNAYGPVGCRDMFTLNNLKEMGVNTYFSGCITMTIPKMPETSDKGQYICVVDVAKKAANKLHEMLDGKIEIREISHLRERDETIPWETRRKSVEELLTVYQNARCIVTRRLHCALPCLAMGVPVLLVRGNEDDTRFDPYYDLLHRAALDDFMNDDYEYDFLDPPENKGDYKQYSESLAKTASEFVASVKDDDRSTDELCKTSFTDEELKLWRHDVMKNALEIWLNDDHLKHEKEVKKNKEITRLKKQEKLAEKRQTEIKKLDAKVNELKEKEKKKDSKINELEKKNKALSSDLSSAKKEIKKLKDEPFFSIFKRKLKNRIKRMKLVKLMRKK